jgi:hypothetical protein
MHGTITRSRARQLSLQVRSNLVNCVFELRLGVMDVLLIRNLKEDQQVLGKGHGFREEKQGHPQQGRDQVQRDGSGYLFGCQIFGLLSSIMNK